MKTKKKKNEEERTQLALEEEHRIRKAFKDKDWAEIKSSDSWDLEWQVNMRNTIIRLIIAKAVLLIFLFLI